MKNRRHIAQRTNRLKQLFVQIMSNFAYAGA
jgi:hypothetical protein